MTAIATPTRPALRYHGGKFRLAPWLMQFFPPHGCYVEPFGGAAGVLLRKPRVYAEVYNDMDGDIVNFFRVLRDPAMRADLVEACGLTPYAREEFDLAYEPTDDPLERARRTCVRAAMGFGSAGATQATTGFRTDTRRKYGTAQHNWADYPHALGAIGERFTGVLIENRDAIDVLQAHDGPDTLLFVDPPYVHETRHMRNKGGYRHELDDAGHQRLLDALNAVDGMVVLSGYDTPLYQAALSNWTRHTTEARISGGRGTSLRTEVAWLNPACAAALDRHAGAGGLFGHHDGVGTSATTEPNDDGPGTRRTRAAGLAAGRLRTDTMSELRQAPPVSVREREAPLREMQLEPRAEQLRTGQHVAGPASAGVKGQDSSVLGQTERAQR